MTQPTLTEFDHSILLDLLAQRAELLDANLLDGYKPGFESELAEELIYGLTASQRADALDWLVMDRLSFGMVSGYLDECNAGTYQAAEAMGSLLLAEIHAQQMEATALRRLVLDEICEGQKLIAFGRQQQAA